MAPTAVINPILPAIKYEKTLFGVSPRLLAYFLKLGIFNVLLSSAWVKGLSNDEDVDEASERPLRCWERAVMAGRDVADGSCCLVQARMSDPDVARRGGIVVIVVVG